jgi:hypothetical protein
METTNLRTGPVRKGGSRRFRRAVGTGAVLACAMTATLSFAAPPTAGTVVEGTSVPGIALGFSRAQVDASWGAPSYCQSGSHSGDLALCTFNIEGVGGVNVRYAGQNGGDPHGSVNDVVAAVDWSGLSDWVTTRGITTANALSDPQGVVAAYPEAQVASYPDGHLYLVRDQNLGIQVTWIPIQYTPDFYVDIQIFPSLGPAPPPPAAPTGLTATAAGTKKIALSWVDNSDNEEGFTIERCSGSYCAFRLVATVDANTTSYVDGGRQPGKLYIYRVRAFNAGGYSAYSNTASAEPGR